jgi:hypothetical protein
MINKFQILFNKFVNDIFQEIQGNLNHPNNQSNQAGCFVLNY